MTGKIISASFRDPSGFVFNLGGTVYRQINISYKDNYDHLMASGLYQSLVDAGLLIPHEEVDLPNLKSDGAYKVIKPEAVEFISYPYEWCFSELKDAALATLKIEKTALDFGMSLKDCSAYNIQFRKGIPVFIDTLSFEKYREGKPWVAYRQFCQHFLAPLLLMSYRDIRLGQLLRVYLDGIPLDLASLLLPIRTYLRFSLLLHIHLHAKSKKYYAEKSEARKSSEKKFGIRSLRGLVESLESSVNRTSWRAGDSVWTSYYDDQASYTADAVDHKKQLVAEFIERTNPKVIWDLGANTGSYSQLAGDRGIKIISFDMDPACVELNYLATVSKAEKNILPLLLDLTNPSPKIGWENQERMTIFDRGPADTALALALVHHLAIANNLPLGRVAAFFGRICRSLIIEFVPKNDPMVQKLLLMREDIFTSYTEENFEGEFGKFFTIQRSVRIRDSERTLYLMQGK